MFGWLWRPLLVLSLGLALVLGPSLSVLHAGEMTATPTLAVGMDSAGCEHREGCDHKGGPVKTSHCHLPCVSVGPALLPLSAALPIFERSPVPATGPGLLPGRAIRPDPHPPRRPTFV